MPCFKPVEVPKKGYVDLRVTVACGQCIGCRTDRALDWRTRLVHEAKLHPSSVFGTFTYDDEHIPPGGSLRYADFQKFLKRLRRSRDGDQISYFCAPEYGDQSMRPHYHAIIYGVDFPDKAKHSGEGANTLFRSEELAQLWGHGFASFGSVTPDSCRYVADYVFKRCNGALAELRYSRVDPATGLVYQVEPEKGRMSTRPAIGYRFFEKFQSDFYPSDVAIVKGQECAVPKAYLRKLEDLDPELYEEMKAKHRAEALERREDSTPERLAVREEVCAARQGLRKRKL